MIIFGVLLTTGIFVLSKYGNAVKPILTGVPDDIGKIIADHNTLPPEKNDTDFPLTIPDDFFIEVLADVPNARAIVRDSNANLWVSRPKDNAIAFIGMKEGKVDQVDLNIFKNHTFNKPHGLAIDPRDPSVLYIAEEDKIVRVAINAEEKVFEKIVDLPIGGRHTTRSLVFGSDGVLYVSIGSTCDVCNEADDRAATIMRVNIEKKVVEPYAKGLRNSVFMAVDPVNGALWATEMGRDLLGDNLPPDELNIIEEGKNYGWPNCYGKNIHDMAFDKNTYIRNPCMEPFETGSHIDLGAHVAPLGLAFIPKEGWPEFMGNDLLVAEHGSWNSKKPVGYKIVRIERDDVGNKVAETDFISGWLTSDNRALGRPVDVLAVPGGTLYVTDDKAGVVYRLQYTPE